MQSCRLHHLFLCAGSLFQTDDLCEALQISVTAEPDFEICISGWQISFALYRENASEWRGM